MSYLALYRRYRPDTFDKLIGQDHIVKTLTNQIMSGRLGHAYLFTGTRGTGKTSTAKIFSKAINCLDPVNGSPCGKCEVCKDLADPSNIDIIEIDAASNNGVDQIRELREQVQYPPVSCKYKVYIIDEVHMLTGQAFNALLKTLEEPPKHAVFILATTEVHKIPATILSRCMRFDFKLVPTKLIAEHIKEIYDELGKKYDEEAVYAIAKAGEGSIRDALSIADTALSYSEGKLTYEQVMELLGSSNFEDLIEFIGAIIDNDAGKVLDTIDKLANVGKSFGVLTNDVTSCIRDLLVIKESKNAQDILLLPEDKFSLLVSVANRTTPERLLRILEIFADTESSLKYSTHPRVLFEKSSILATRPESDYNIDALIGRIGELEKQLKNGVKIASINNEIKAEKVEIKEEQKQEEQKFKEMPSSPKGTLLQQLRKNNKEMLYLLMQEEEVDIKDNILTINVMKEEDFDLINLESNKLTIKELMSEYGDFDINVIVKKVSHKEDEIADATERFKKIFGDDIVIIK